MKNKKIILRVAMLLCLFGFAIACKDDNVNPSKPEPSNPLVGVWYIPSSRETDGIKVTFTDSSVTAFDYHNYVEVLLLFYENTPYLLENDTLKVLEPLLWMNQNAPVPKPSKITFHTKDSITIEHFLPINWNCQGWPNCYGWPVCFPNVDLHRRGDND